MELYYKRKNEKELKIHLGKKIENYQKEKKIKIFYLNFIKKN